MQSELKLARRWTVSAAKNENPSESDIKDAYEGKYDGHVRFKEMLSKAHHQLESLSNLKK